MSDFKITEAHKRVLAALYRAAGSANPVRVEAVIEDVNVIEEIARDCGVARVRVKQAIQHLRDRGLLAQASE
jgi:DNA-binding MarR family transcriptional regulator